MGDFSPETIAKMIPFALLFLIGFLTFFGALFGLARAWKKSLLRFSSILVAFLLALLLTAPLSSAFDTNTFATIFAGAEGDDVVEFFAMLPSLLPVAIGILRPFLFLALFLVLSILMWIIYFIVSFFVRTPKGKKKRRLLGALIGGLQGLFVALVILTPVFGYMSLTEDVTASYQENVGDDLDDFLTEYNVYATPVKESKPLQIASTLTKPIFKITSSFRIGDDHVVLADEIELIFNGYTKIMSITDGGKNDEQIEKFRDLSEIIQQSAILPNVASEFISGLSTAWVNGEDFVGIERPETPEEVDNIFNELFTIFTTTTRTTLTRDIDTILDIATLYFDYDLDDAFKKDGDFFAKVTAAHPDTGKTFIVAALEILEENEHMQPLRDEVLALGFSYIGEQLGTPLEIRENYGDMAAEAAEILRGLEGSSDEEKIAELTPILKEKMAETDEIDVPDEVVDEFSKYFLEKLNERGTPLSSVTDDDILDIMIEFSEEGNIS